MIEERVKSILSRNDSPDVNFDLSINPVPRLRARLRLLLRPADAQLPDLSPGLDFETQIIAKVNAAERLREAFAARGYQPTAINIGSATDAYQPVERKLGITRSVIEVLAECSHPFSLVTKSSGIERDLDLVAPMAAARPGRGLRLGDVARPGARPHPRAARRGAASAPQDDRDAGAGRRAGGRQRLADHPVHQRARDRAHPRGRRRRPARARPSASSLRLPWEVNPIFQRWLDQHFPERAARVMARIREMRGGSDYDASFGTRMRGEGVWAELIAQRLAKARKRFGLDRERRELDLGQFRKPLAVSKVGQGDLFG